MTWMAEGQSGERDVAVSYHGGAGGWAQGERRWASACHFSLRGLSSFSERASTQNAPSFLSDTTAPASPPDFSAPRRTQALPWPGAWVQACISAFTHFSVVSHPAEVMCWVPTSTSSRASCVSRVSTHGHPVRGTCAQAERPALLSGLRVSSLWRASLGPGSLRRPLHHSRALEATQTVSSPTRGAQDQDTGVLSLGSVTDSHCHLEQTVSLSVYSPVHLYKGGGLADEVPQTQDACVLRAL